MSGDISAHSRLSSEVLPKSIHPILLIIFSSSITRSCDLAFLSPPATFRRGILQKVFMFPIATQLISYLPSHFIVCCTLNVFYNYVTFIFMELGFALVVDLVLFFGETVVLAFCLTIFAFCSGTSIFPTLLLAQT